MDNKPLVSVVIPTFNSGKTLAKCLESIKNQTYENVKVVVIDSYSKDKTIKIAKKFGAKIVLTAWKLMGARYVGLKESNGVLILMLDSDQILEETAIERSVTMIMDGYDMLCLEEHTYQPKTWIQKLFEADRKLIHKLADVHLDPIEGVLLARFYKRDVLEKAFKDIPKELFPSVVAHDHAFIYYEAYKVSKKVGLLPNAVWHIEPASLVELWKKNYRYGKTTKELVKTGFYQELLKKKVRFRKGAFKSKNLKLALQSYILLLLKGLPYKIGYWIGEGDKNAEQR